MLAKRGKISRILGYLPAAFSPLHAVGCWLLLMTMTTEQENNAGALLDLQLSSSSLSAISFLNKIIYPIELIFPEIMISFMCLSNFWPTDAGVRETFQFLSFWALSQPQAP